MGCYTFHDIDSTWTEARDSCRNVGAQLVTMETTEDWEKLKDFLKDKVKETGSYTHYYIGLRREGGKWKWTETGSPGITVARNDNRWQLYEPSGHYLEDCAEINSYYQGRYGHFNNVKCNYRYRKAGNAAPRGYICEDL